MVWPLGSNKICVLSALLTFALVAVPFVAMAVAGGGLTVIASGPIRRGSRC